MKINQKVDIQSLKSVREENTFIIFDDFFADLDTHFQIIKKQQYQIFSSRYPGKQLVIDQKHRNVFHQALRNSVNGEIILENDTGWIGSLSGEISKFGHVDPGYLILLVYLFDSDTENESVEFGTHFMEHKKLGIRHLTKSKRRLLEQQMITFDSHNLDAWKIWKTIPVKRNRAVLFSGDMIHSLPFKGFGDSIESSRLTQNFFIKLKE